MIAFGTWPAHGHGILLAAVFAVVASKIVLPAGLIAGCAGCWAGAILASGHKHRRRRLFVACGLVVFGWLLSGCIVYVSGPSYWFGMQTVVQIENALQWCSITLGVVFLLRSFAAWSRSFLLVEASLLVFAVASLVSAHRDGMIARPLALADQLWRRGIDPVVGLLAVGLSAAALGVASFSKGETKWKVGLRLLLAILLLVGVSIYLNHNATLPPLDEKEGEGGPSEANQESGSGSSLARGLEEQGVVKSERRPMAVVVFKKTLKPVNRVFYFRNTAFSSFNGLRLVEPNVGGPPRSFPTDALVLDAHNLEGRNTSAYEVSLLQDHDRPFLLTDPLTMAPRSNPNPARFRRSFQGVSQVVDGEFSSLLGRTAGEMRWDVETWQRLTEIPRDSRYLALSQRIISVLPPADREDPLARALAVKNYLEQATIYTFELSFGSSGKAPEDPVASFLFREGDLRGSCTHIAHSAALLLRALNVPARVSAGYGVESNRLHNGSALLLMSGDAHAWLEVYLSGVGWVPIEITPERVDGDFEPPEVQDLQQLLGEMARESGLEQPEPEVVSTFWPNLWRAAKKVVPWAFLLLTLILYAVRPLSYFLTWARPEAVGLAFRSSLDALGALGLRRARGESREAFAARIGHRSPEFSVLTELMMARVLGLRTTGRAVGGRTAAQIARAVRQELARSTPIWRRFLGWCIPLPRLWCR